MAFTDLSINDNRVRLFVPESGYDTLIYIPVSEVSTLDEIISTYESPDFAAAAVACTNWNDQLTPWPAPAPFRSQPDFTGGADRFLSTLTEEIIPAVEKTAGAAEFRGIAGYSLGGLFSLYAFYSCSMFSLCGCVSGSVWYDGFLDWIMERTPAAESGSVFFSLGNREEKTRNARMQHTGEIMRKIAESLNETESYEAHFHYTHGTHFDGHNERMHECLDWLMGK